MAVNKIRGGFNGCSSEGNRKDKVTNEVLKIFARRVTQRVCILFMKGGGDLKINGAALSEPC